MLEISLDDSDLQRGLGQLLRNARHPRLMMRAIAAELLSITEDNFENENWGGQIPWKPTHRGGKILQKSGQLAASIHTASGSNFARIGTNKPYAAIHQFGGTVKAKNKPYLVFKVGDGFRRVKQVKIPARPYLPISKGGTLQAGAESRLLDVALDALAKGVRK